jgi:hypothetical protein
MKAAEAADTAKRIEAALPAIVRIEAIDKRLGALEGERRELRGRLPKAEAAAALGEWLRWRRERFETGTGTGLEANALEAVSAVSAGRRPKLRDEKHLFDLLLFLLGARVDEMVREAVDRLDYPEGAGIEERRRKGDALEREREALVSERERLVGKAQTAGIGIEHLAETRLRLEAEAAREKDEAEEAERQAEAAATIEARRGGARSAYLETGGGA